MVLPENEVANPSLQQRLQNAVLYNQRTYPRLNVFCCPLLFYVYKRVWLQVRCHMPCGSQATCCRSLSCFPKHTEKSHGSVLWSSTWSAACWLDAVREPLTATGALIPAFPVPRSSPARQLGYAESSITLRKHMGFSLRVGLGGWVSVFVSLWFRLGLVGVCCGVVLPLFYFISGKRWRDDTSREVRGCPLHSVRRRWLKTDDPAVCLHL